MTDKTQDQTQIAPHPELKRLNALVGKWQSEGHTYGSESEPSINIRGTDEYEWLPGGFFLIHRVDVKMGDQHVNVLEMIGPYDEASRTFLMRSFDNQGQFQVMQASVSQDGVWTFASDTIRATLTISSDLTHMTAHWEQKQAASDWQPWMEMHFKKASV